MNLLNSRGGGSTQEEEEESQIDPRVFYSGDKGGLGTVWYVIRVSVRGGGGESEREEEESALPSASVVHGETSRNRRKFLH